MIIKCICSLLLLLVIAFGACNKIVEENLLNGTKAWWHPQTIDSPSIEGFATTISAFPGSVVEFKIHCKLLTVDYDLEIYRLGYYGGKGGRKVAVLPFKSSDCSPQEKCIWFESLRLTDCANWKTTISWKVPDNAVSGVYVAIPTTRTASIIGGYIPFVIRSYLPSDILFKTSDSTWVAYNKYGGANIYGFNHSKDFATRAFAASYNRPFANRLVYPIGQQQNFLFGSEYPMLYWLEKYGYDVTYIASGDIEDFTFDRNSSQYKLLLSVGHDEYWSLEMKKQFIAAREAGIHLAFFSGNEIFWRIVWHERYKQVLQEVLTTNQQLSNNSNLRSAQRASAFFNESHGLLPKSMQRRILFCFKESLDNISTIDSRLWTGTFVDPRHQPHPDPENSLTRQLFLVNSYRNDSLLVNAEDGALRFWRNTSFYANALQLSTHRPHSIIYRSPAGVLGYEMDIFVDDVFRHSGVIGLSTTTLKIAHMLSENYGASYRGSGTVTHRLTLYRHYSRDSGAGGSMERFDATRGAKEGSSFSANSSSTLEMPNQHDKSSSPKELPYIHDFCAFVNRTANLSTSSPFDRSHRSALVFGAGTIQWAWALSSFRDGDPMVPDGNLQQATLNLLADMEVLPHHPAKGGKYLVPEVEDENRDNNLSHALYFPSPSTDNQPPRSTISRVLLTPWTASNGHNRGGKRLDDTAIAHRNHFVRMRGTAHDVGGGHVAAVEVSLDGGKVWHQASGRGHWRFDFPLVGPSLFPPPTKQHGFQLTHGYLFDTHLHPTQSSLYRLREHLFQKRALYSHGLASSSNASSQLYFLVLSRAVDDSGNLEEVTEEMMAISLCSLLPSYPRNKMLDGAGEMLSRRWSDNVLLLQWTPGL